VASIIDDMIPRPVYRSLWEDLAASKAMVFMAGPRQAGKTTLANAIADDFTNRVYFNWDIVTDRKKLIRDPYYFEAVERRDESPPFVVFDEIHKHRLWKNYLKGVYDKFHDEFRFLVTGSGRLDTYRKGGDSLAGRYALFHLWPFTLGELSGPLSTLDEFLTGLLDVFTDKDGAAATAWRRLARFSGFPEPYSRAQPRAYRRWSTTYHSQLIREDIRDLTGIRAIGDVETLFSLLPERVGSLLSITSLAEDLRVSYNTMKSWLDVLERFYMTFSIAPWTRKMVRATQKARKTYLLDYAVIEDTAARFENMVALELFRAVSTWNDLGHGPFGLHFIRNKEKEEVDFLLTKKRRPMLIVETKKNDTAIAPSLMKFQSRLRVPAVQLTDGGTSFRKMSNDGQTVLVVPAHMWLPRLP
jgi:predicted AAA+ superfamily ATPase